MFFLVFSFIAVFCLGVLIGAIVKPGPQTPDGHLVITHNDGKTTMSFEFDDGDQMVELRNKQRVVFEVVGPDTVVFEDEDTPS